MSLRRIMPGEPPWPKTQLAFPDVSAIVGAVEREGDRAVSRFAAAFGDPIPRRVPETEIDDAKHATDRATLEVILRASSRIKRFARAQRDALHNVTMHVGSMVIGHRAMPVERVGIYVPGGQYPLPSTLLMCAIPARVAGVSNIIVCTPRASREMLTAAYETGVDDVFEIGGAQAIAAMAYGTDTVPQVDLIVGPGNAYVAAAKRLVYGVCGIDMLAGPSEVLIVASSDARPAYIAADMIAQAEHDVMARTLLLTDDPSLADAVDDEIDRQLSTLANAAIARASLREQGRCVIASLSEAVRLVNAIAPEHLELHGERAEALASEMRAYGTLFSGSSAAEAFGDYGAGPNHVLPTSANARFSSGLSVYTFLTLRTYQRCEGGMDPGIIADTIAFASIEGLHAHAAAAQWRSSATDVMLRPLHCPPALPGS